MIMYGFYKVGQTNQEKSHNRLEERRVRYALAPLLQAEADTEYLQREREILEKEKQIMKDVPGWMPGKSPYFTGRWMPRKVDQFDRGLK
jgi:NADH dehydrogenase (ubiquinone) 1 alpha subcomplex subunit 13